jgi:hypothetical protein
MKDLAVEMAERFYNAHERLIFARINFSKTSLASKLWKDAPERERLEHIEAFRQVLADQEIWQTLVNRAAGI